MESRATPASRFAAAARTGFAVFLVVLVLAMFPYTRQPTAQVKELLVRLAGFALPVLLLLGRPRRAAGAGIAAPFVAGFLLAETLAWAVNPFRGHASEWLTMLLAYGGLYSAAACAFREPGRTRAPFLALNFAVLVSTLYAVAQRLGLDPMPWAGEHLRTDVYASLPGTFGNPNLAAHTLILCIVATCFLGARVGWRWTWLFLAPFTLHLYATTQRAGWLGLGAAGLLTLTVLLVRRRGLRPKRAVASALLTAAAAGLLLAVLALAAFRVASGSALPTDRSLLLRGTTYAEAGRMAAERPLRGYGPGNYRIHNPRYWSAFSESWYANKRYTKEYVHNEVLETAVDAGIVNGLLYGAMFAAGIVAGLYLAFAAADPDRRRFGLMAAAFFTAFLVDGMFGFNFHAPVSGALAVTVLGMTDGVYGAVAAPVRAWPRQPVVRTAGTAAAVLALALVAGHGVRVFAAEWLLARGNAQAYWGMREEAAATLARAERLAPWNEEIPRAAGHNQQARGPAGFAGAAAAFERARRDAPWALATLIAQQQAQLNRALLAREQGRPEWREALGRPVATAARAQALCPVLPEAQTTLGVAALLGAESAGARRERVETLRAARDHFQRALVFGTRNPERPLAQCAAIARTLGDRHGEWDAWKQVLQADPGNSEALKGLFALAADEESREALADLLQRELERAEADAAIGVHAHTRLMLARARVARLQNGPGGAARLWEARAAALLR